MSINMHTREVGRADYVVELDVARIAPLHDRWEYRANIQRVTRRFADGQLEDIRDAPSHLHYGETAREAEDKAMSAFDAWLKRTGQ